MPARHCKNKKVLDIDSLQFQSLGDRAARFREDTGALLRASLDVPKCQKRQRAPDVVTVIFGQEKPCRWVRLRQRRQNRRVSILNWFSG